MVSYWLKTQKKPSGTNQIRAQKFKKMAVVFGKERFDFVCKTTMEQFSKNPRTVKSTSFWLNVLKMWC